MRAYWLTSLTVLSGLVLHGCGAGTRPYVPAGSVTTPTPVPSASPTASPTPNPAPRFFTITARAQEIFEPHRVEIDIDCLPQNLALVGAVSVERVADGTLLDENGQSLMPLPENWEVLELPKALTFDGTGATRSLRFYINPGGRPAQTTRYGVRIRAGATEKVIPIEASGSEWGTE